MVREFQLSPGDFIYPLFVHEGTSKRFDRRGCPGLRWSLDGLVEEVGPALGSRIRCVVALPKVADGLKSEDGLSVSTEGGLIPRRFAGSSWSTRRWRS